MLDKMQANESMKNGRKRLVIILQWFAMNQVSNLRLVLCTMYDERWTILLYFMCTFAPMKRMKQLLSEREKIKRSLNLFSLVFSQY